MMNCETIDSLLDDHLVARLSPAERKRAADHVSGCARCSAAWAVDEALRAETIADPAPELFAALLRRTAAMPARSGAPRRRRWASLGAAAAVLAIVAVAARLAVIEPDRAAPPEALSTAATVAAGPFVAGRDYEVVTGAPVRLGAAARAVESIEVVEFFMFECFPCYALEADLNRWEAEQGSAVSLTRVPAMFNPVARLQARAYYTAEALGKPDAMRADLYDEIHLRENPLDSRELLADFFGRFGVDRATFDATFDSSDVEARMERAVALNRDYGIQATPTLVVAGRYSTNPLRAGFAVVDHLVAKARDLPTPLR